ncbi:MAG: ComEC/Rec2 family competence protein, partial [Ginsengibacter sp.]
MVRTYKIYVWKTAPFLRLLAPVIAGILLEYYLKFTSKNILLYSCCLFVPLLWFTFLPLSHRFKLRIIQGILIASLLLMAGAFLTWNKNIRNQNSWYGNHYDSSSLVVASVVEPPVEKAKSYKIVASVDAVINKDRSVPTIGNALLYLEKDSSSNTLALGDRIIIGSKLQRITNSGNPGAFDYARYAAFHQLFHQAYLRRNDWTPAGSKDVGIYNRLIFSLQKKIRSIIYKFIPGDEEKSIAIAILIGYKVDLDKDLVQAYSNAGVVHLIAISGLHMGIIYSILFWLFTKIPIVRKSRVTRLILILFCLWFFALLTGASGSVLRSAFMFSFISIGLTVNKKASIYNSMAASAFLLLCYNPFLLWDVGFQLSYLAVLGIVLAQRYISKWLYFKNKFLNGVWQLSSVSLAAQLFTFPVCLYYFHQLPLFFLISNLVAIPLMTIALWLCILLVLCSPVYIIATIVGKIIFVLVWLINHTVFFVNSMPFSLWDNVSTTAIETLLMYGVVCCCLFWLIRKDKLAFRFTLAFILIITFVISINNWQSFNQKEIVVYNIPAHKAFDFISGVNYQFAGDSEMKVDGVLKNFHLKPSRISFMLRSRSRAISGLAAYENFYQFYNRRILLIDTAVNYEIPKKRIAIDYIIISRNPKIFIPAIARV